MNALEVAEVDAWWSRVQALTVLILLRILVFLRTNTIPHASVVNHMTKHQKHNPKGC